MEKLYVWDKELLRLRQPFVVGDVTVEAKVLNVGFGIKNVSFYVDRECRYVDERYPFEMVLREPFVGERNITVFVYDLGGQFAKDEIEVFVLNLGLFSQFFR